MSVAHSAPLTVEQVHLDQLRPDPANPRRIGDEELDALTRSLREFGFVQPVLARKEDGVVIGGHQRLVAARRLGLATVPVTYLDLSIEQARLLNLALLASQEARSSVETRYLDGHQALFPDVAAAFEKQLRSSQEIAVTAVRLGELDGLPPAALAEPDGLSGRTAELVTDLAEPAKADALEKLGEGRRAFDIAVSWLRPKFIVTPVPVPDTRSL